MKNSINWEKGGGLVPAIIQDFNGSVLMLGYMNQKAFEKTLETGKVWFYSRSKKRLWMKGETSGNVLEFVGVSVDCDQDALLIKVKVNGPTCHNGTRSCFDGDEGYFGFEQLFRLISQRKLNKIEGSYTVSLFNEGINKICEKVEEESEEVVRAAKSETQERLIEESVDLIYHLFVLLVNQGIDFEEIVSLMGARNRMGPVN